MKFVVLSFLHNRWFEKLREEERESAAIVFVKKGGYCKCLDIRGGNRIRFA